jgi:hypothetical protein
MGIDATVPFGYESDFLRPVYPVDKVKPEDFFDNVKSRMHGWVSPRCAVAALLAAPAAAQTSTTPMKSRMPAGCTGR